MTRIILKTLIIIILAIRCAPKPPIKEAECSDEKLFCSKGLMQRAAYYDYGSNEAIPTFKGRQFENGFSIVVDTHLKMPHFIASSELYFRTKIAQLTIQSFAWQYDPIEEWAQLTAQQQAKRVKEQRIWYQKQADSTHLANNQGQNQVWLVNNSTDTVQLQIQNESLVGVLQAKTKENIWKPVEYWRFARCGMGYHVTDLLPQKAMRLLTDLPNKGDFKTKFRYKILGGKQYHYSNEFDGAIDYCHFVEDSSSYDDQYVGGLRPHFTLDTFFYSNFYK